MVTMRHLLEGRRLLEGGTYLRKYGTFAEGIFHESLKMGDITQVHNQENPLAKTN